VTAQVVVSGTVLREQPASGLGHSVAHHKEHRAGKAGRFKEQPPGNIVGHQCTTLHLDMDPTRLDYHVEPLVWRADGLAGLDA
jgi:hypothetical protein